MATTHSPETNFNTVTSWLPLTTTFPYQSGCSEAIWVRWGFISSSAFDAVAFDPRYGITVDPALICVPSQATLWWETETAPILNGLTTLYSVGPIVCPEAYTLAGTSMINAQSTQVACCPSAYKFRQMQGAGLVGECASSVSKGFVVTYVMEKVPGTIASGLTTTSTTMANDYYVLGVPVNGFNFAAPTSLSSSSSSSSSSSVTTTSSGTSSPLPTKISAASSGGLSTGAKAGIGVAAAVAGIAFIVFAFLLFKYLRKRQGADGNNLDEKGQRGPVHELHDMDRPHEIGSSGPRPPELSA